MAETISPELMWPQSCLSLAVDLWDSAEKVPDYLAQKMRACASKTDSVFLKINHDLSPHGNGFVTNAVTSTLQPGRIRKGKADTTKRLFTDTWATEYGAATDAQVAMLCLLRYEQIGENKYKKLFLDAAARYMKSEPDTGIVLYPGAVGDAIAVLIEAYRITGEKSFLDRADEFGKRALDIFFGNSSLPRASNRHDHYEAITRGDTLVMELLNLWAELNNVSMQYKLVYNDR